MELYVVVMQEKKHDIVTAAVWSGIKCGRNSMAKIPSPNQHTLCTKLAPRPTNKIRIISPKFIFSYLFKKSSNPIITVCYDKFNN